MATYKRNEPRRMWRPFAPPPPAVPSTRDRRPQVRVRAGLARPAFADDARAACRRRGVDPDWWFAPSDEPGRQTTGADADRAAGICQAACPLQLACFDHAASTGEVAGIWGGERFPLGRKGLPGARARVLEDMAAKARRSA